MKALTLLFTLILSTTLFGQSYSALDTILKVKLPKSMTTGSNWVYYPEKAFIRKVEKPIVQSVLKSFDIYKLNLTNYLDWHMNEGICVVLFDSLNSEIVLVQPIWYGGISEPLIKLFLKKKFDDIEKLMSFLNELNEIMEIGSGYKFVNTSSKRNLITYDLVAFKGDSYITGGNGTKTKISYTNEAVFRQIEIKIKDLKIVSYTSLNPLLKGEKDYKETIK